MESTVNDIGYLITEDGKKLVCEGSWTVATLKTLEDNLKTLMREATAVVSIDASKIDRLDSAGALFLEDLRSTLSQTERDVDITGLKSRFQNLFRTVAQEIDEIHHPPEKAPLPNWLYRIGEASAGKYDQLCSFMSFVGELSLYAFYTFIDLRRLQWRSMLNTVDDSGYQALPIVALMSFLIGIVLAYQLGVELRLYGATIFVVDVTGIGILREFGPLLTAVILAGRTSTSFAALIGTMKVNEEIDAIKTMGLSPIERLVLPKVLGLLIAVPLLSVWADIFGIMGSMVMSKAMLNINYGSFLERLEYAVGVKHYILGLVKAPVFGLIIAGVGCFQGFQVELSAESVGRKTTTAAVQTIFLIIIADAAFSVIYSWMNL